MSNYATVQEVKDYRPTESSTVLDFTGWSDVQLQALIDESEVKIESGCNDIFYPKEDTVIVNGNGGESLFLAQDGGYPYRIVSLVSVQEIDFDGSVEHTYLQPTDYVSEVHSILINTGTYNIRSRSGAGVWPRGRRNIKVVGTFGEATVPDLIKKATILLTICLSLGPDKAGIGEKSFSDMVEGNKTQELWTDYQVSYSAGGEGGSGVVSRDDGVVTITGFVEVDRILSGFVNYADLFMAV